MNNFTFSASVITKSNMPDSQSFEFFHRLHIAWECLLSSPLLPFLADLILARFHRRNDHLT
jgi:hypothetical protein